MFVANGLMDDPAMLRSRLDVEGYLFLRSAVDAAKVAPATRDVLEVFANGGFVADSSDNEWTGAGDPTQVSLNAITSLESVRALHSSPEMQAIYRALFGEDGTLFETTMLRFNFPGDDIHVIPPHQDGVANGPNTDFLTFWIALVDVPRAMGGLAVAAGSHLRGLLRHPEHPTQESVVFPGARHTSVEVEAVAAGSWRTADFEAGDLVVFHAYTVHGGVPNRTNRIRLSVDRRAQPRSTPLAWSNSQPQSVVLKFRETAIRMGLPPAWPDTTSMIWCSKSTDAASTEARGCSKP
jgi:ectoine hydroxylase-related dioxygenase (phytanoyl-CoA dioxygenase family)